MGRGGGGPGGGASHDYRDNGSGSNAVKSEKSKGAPSLTHDLLRVLSMDTWWNFGHELKKGGERKDKNRKGHIEMVTTAGSNHVEDDVDHTWRYHLPQLVMTPASCNLL